MLAILKNLKTTLKALNGCLIDESLHITLWVPVFFGCGILLYFHYNLAFNLYHYTFMAVALATCCIIFRQYFAIFYLSLLSLVIILGAFTVYSKIILVNSPILKQPTLTININANIKNIELKQDTIRLIIDNIIITDPKFHDQVPKYIRIFLKKNDPRLNINDTISFRARLLPPLEPSIPGGHDFRIDSYFAQIGAVGFLVGDITIIKPANSFSLFGYINYLRNRMSKILFQDISASSAAITAALINGDQGGILDSDYNAMRKSGLVHLISISGLHLNLVAMMIFYLTRSIMASSYHLATNYNIKRIAAIFALFGSFFYLVFASMPSPAVRSFVMTGLILVAIMLDIKSSSLRNIALSALVILIYQPEAILSPSFQMSFSAVTVLISGFNAAKKYFIPKPEDSFFTKILRHFFAIIISSLLAEAATAPFSIYHFHQFSNYGVIANIFAIPFSSFVIMPLAILGSLLMPFSLEKIPLQALDIAIALLLKWANLIANLPFASISNCFLTTESFVFLIIGGLILCLCVSSLKYIGFGFIVAALLTNYLSPFIMPDILITGTSKNFAIRDQKHNLYFSTPNIPKYLVQSWQYNDPTPIKTLDQLHDANIRCYSNKCTIYRNNQTIDIILTGENFYNSCNYANLIINLSCKYSFCNEKTLLNDNKHKNGNYAIYVIGDKILISAASYNIDKNDRKPWEN